MAVMGSPPSQPRATARTNNPTDVVNDRVYRPMADAVSDRVYRPMNDAVSDRDLKDAPETT
jgi:hypothetical protein